LADSVPKSPSELGFPVIILQRNLSLEGWVA